VSRVLPGLLIVALALPAVAQERDLMTDVPSAVVKLRRHAQRVWNDARAVDVEISIERGAAGHGLSVRMVLITGTHIVDAELEAAGAELPTVSLGRRTTPVAIPDRRAWERDFNVLSKFDWVHVTGDWLDRCGFPRAEDLAPGESLHMHLERMRRIPVLVIRYSEGDEVCHVDDRGTVVYLFEEV